MMNKIYLLICEDASSLGGPMGSQHTDFMWIKPFSDRDKAKTYAEKYAKRKADKWNGIKILEWDSGPYYFTIKEEKVL
jgi:hypothetical protein